MQDFFARDVPDVDRARTKLPIGRRYVNPRMMNGDRGKQQRRPARILIAYKYVPQYRQAFFDQLRVRLAEDGVVLDLVYGDPNGNEEKKSDAVHLAWATHLPNRYVNLGSTTLTYQPILRLSAHYDLVIVEQANKLLVNPLLLAMNQLGITRVAFWGHGKDFQGGDSVIARRVKRALVPHVHWWFAYNEMSAAVVRDAGFPKERITLVMNTIDNEAMRAHLEDVTCDEVEAQRSVLGLRGRNVCIFVGAMYDKKRLSFLLAACEKIRIRIPDFEMVFLGGGVDKPLIDSFAAKHSWVIACGPTFGRAKAVTLKLAKLLLMPGLVGLAIIDAFAAQVPIVTTDVPYHSPEIEYLIDGVNGEMVAPIDDVDAYAERVTLLLMDPALLSKLRRGCGEAAQKYTMRSMVDRFADGIVKAIMAEV